MAATQRNAQEPVPTYEIFGKTIETSDSSLRIPTISYGLPFDQAVLNHITPDARVYIIASRTLSTKTDSLDRLKVALGSHVVGVRIGMTSHTIFQECLEVAAAARAVSANTIMTLGAGSLSDAAKFVCDALTNHFSTLDDLEKAEDANPHKHRDEPNWVSTDWRQPPTGRLILIPTSLSGGEHTEPAGITDSATKRKYQIHSKGSDVTILDPWLCLSTPKSIWLASGIRGLDHCVEAILSIAPNAEATATLNKALRLLLPGLLDCQHDDTNSDVRARLNAQIGVALAILGLCAWYVPCGASHAIGHMLGPMGVAHGETSCILLPAVCKYNAQVAENEERQAGLRQTLWAIPACKEIFDREGLREVTADLGDLLDAIIRELGMPRTLKEKKIEGAQVRDLAEMSLKDYWVKTNPRPLRDADEVMEILEMVRG